jgi:preprotein translocase subunit YajC
MTFLFFAADPNQQGGGFESLFFLMAIFMVFYFFIIRPQSKRQKELQNKVNALKKGDKIITSGGLVGFVTSIEDNEVLMEADKDVKLRVLKTAIADVVAGK